MSAAKAARGRARRSKEYREARDEYAAIREARESGSRSTVAALRPVMATDTSDAARVREAAAAEAPKHTKLIRSARGGRIVSALTLLPILLWPPSNFGVITTTGRKTGKARRKCIRVVRRGNRAYLVALRPPELAMKRPNVVAAWVWNIRANPNMKLRIRGGTFDGCARELNDSDELAEARAALRESVGLFDYAECSLHLRGLPTRSKIKDLHGYWFDTGIPIVIEFADG